VNFVWIILIVFAVLKMFGYVVNDWIFNFDLVIFLFSDRIYFFYCL
jgi:hypothetical protein